jgi:hypothetical protein
MARFCVNCGNPMAEGARFCATCGASVPGQAAQPPAPPPPQPAQPLTPPAARPPAVSYPAAAPASSGSSSGIKILFIVLAVLAFLGLLAAGSCFYVAYRVKKKANEYKAEMEGSARPYTGQRDACSKLTRREASEALGEPVTAVESQGDSCDYIFGPNGEKQVAIQYTWEGGAMVMKMSHGAMKAISGMETFQAIPGLGDEAYLEPMGSGLMMRKGDVMVNIDMRTGGLSVNAAKTMAEKIAGRL